jgi:hypothetical protein
LRTVLVLPVQALPYKRRGRLGQFKDPTRRIRSRIWDFLRGRFEMRWWREMDSSGVFGGVDGFEGVGSAEMEEVDGVVLRSDSGGFDCFPIYARLRESVGRKAGNRWIETGKERRKKGGKWEGETISPEEGKKNSKSNFDLIRWIRD